MKQTASGVVVRDATETDAGTIAEFNARMALEVEGRQLDPSVALRGARLGVSRQDLARYWIAEIAGQVVGQAMVTWEWSDWRAGVFWWLQSVYVLPEFRRRGVFRAIFRHVESAARETPGVCGLRLYVEQNNHRAQAVYRALGMNPSGHVVYEIDWSGAVRRAEQLPTPPFSQQKRS